MKKNFILLLLISSFVYTAQAQKKTQVRLNAYGAYVFDDKVDNSYSYSTAGYFSGTIKGGFMWGGGLEFRLHEAYGLEILYQRLDTKVPLDYYYNRPNQKTTMDLGINYFLVGGTRSLGHPGGKAEPYGGFLLGMATLNTKSDSLGSGSATKFAWGLRLGTNIWASEKVGIKLQAQFLSIPQGAGGGLYFGTGGAGVGVSTYSSMLQFVIGGGLTFKLGHTEEETHTQPSTGQ
jgi:hypothetical protein